MIGCLCSRLSSDINAFASKEYQQNIIFRALWGWEHLYGRITNIAGRVFPMEQERDILDWRPFMMSYEENPVAKGVLLWRHG